MYRLEHPYFLWFLLLIPIVVAVFFLYKKWQIRQWNKFGNFETAQKQLYGHIKGRSILKMLLLCTSIFLGVLALANIQKKDGTQTIDKKGVDVVFALDVSKSMLANDIQPDRLQKAKSFINALMGQMTNNRIGLVVFAGNAYQQIPITSDQAAVKMILESVNTNMIPNPGTVLSEALSGSNAMFESDLKKYKAIVLITDGEDHDDRAIQAAKEVAETGTLLFTVGIGSVEGTTIIDPETQQPKKDASGAIIVSKLNEAILREIAQLGKGGYIHLTNINKAATSINDAIDQMEKNNLGSSELQQYISYFQYLLGLSIAAFVGYIFLPSTHKKEYTHE